MDTRAVTADRLDHLDAERFADMVSSPPFDILRKRLQSEMERQSRVCESAATLIDIHRAQGGVAALRAALSLPATILNEIRSQKK